MAQSTVLRLNACPWPGVNKRESIRAASRSARSITAAFHRQGSSTRGHHSPPPLPPKAAIIGQPHGPRLCQAHFCLLSNRFHSGCCCTSRARFQKPSQRAPHPPMFPFPSISFNFKHGPFLSNTAFLSQSHNWPLARPLAFRRQPLGYAAVESLPDNFMTLPLRNHSPFPCKSRKGTQGRQVSAPQHSGAISRSDSVSQPPILNP